MNTWFESRDEIFTANLVPLRHIVDVQIESNKKQVTEFRNPRFDPKRRRIVLEASDRRCGKMGLIFILSVHAEHRSESEKYFDSSISIMMYRRRLIVTENWLTNNERPAWTGQSLTLAASCGASLGPIVLAEMFLVYYSLFSQPAMTSIDMYVWISDWIIDLIGVKMNTSSPSTWIYSTS